MISFIAAQYGTVSDIEVFWTLIALIGAFFSMHNLLNSWGDLKFLRRAGIGNGRLLLAKFSIRAEAARTVIQLIFAAIGIAAMTLADISTHGVPHRYIIFGALFRWGLITAASLVALKSYWAWDIRRQLITDRETTENAFLADVESRADERQIVEDERDNSTVDNVAIKAENVTVNGSDEGNHSHVSEEG